MKGELGLDMMWHCDCESFSSEMSSLLTETEYELLSLLDIRLKPWLGLMLDGFVHRKDTLF